MIKNLDKFLISILFSPHYFAFYGNHNFDIPKQLIMEML